MKSKGSYLFNIQVSGKQAEWARTHGFAQSQVNRWALGLITPTMASRTKIHAAGGPDPLLWDEPIAPGATPAPKATAPRKPRDPEARATPEGVRSLADAAFGQAQALQDELEADGADLEARIRMAERLGSLIASLGKLTGAAVLNERQILMSPAFKRIVSVMLEALQPWPDAMRAVAAALEEQGE